MKETKAQKRASDKWRKNNRTHANYLRYRSTARSFIRNHATLDDLDELETLIADKRQILKAGEQQ